MREVPAVQT
jgi:hypothetical protein